MIHRYSYTEWDYNKKEWVTKRVELQENIDMLLVFEQLKGEIIEARK